MSLEELERKHFFEKVDEHYRKNFKTLVNKLSRYLGSRYAAEDIAQTAYLNALTYYKTYDNNKPFENWFRIVTNNAIRAHFKEEIMHGMVDGDFLFQEEMEEKMLKPFFQRIELKQLLKKIEEKSEKVKRILYLFLIEGYTSKEVERVVPESSSNIRKIVQRFRDEIKLKYS